MPEERLQKVIANAGIASRRHAEELIAAGRVTINGEVVTALGTKVDIERDRIEVDGRPLSPEAKAYIVLHKPVGVVTTAEDTHDRQTVIDLVPADLGRLYPVGRLDMESSGLILLTNDGDLAYKLTHPSFEHEKEYRVRVSGQPGERILDTLRRGIELEDGNTLPAEIIVQERERNSTLLRVILREGRKRQLRRMFDAIEHPVRELKRVRLGPLQIGDLRPGEWRPLSVRELQAIRRLAAGFPVKPVSPPQRVGGRKSQAARRTGEGEDTETGGRPGRRPAPSPERRGPRPAQPRGTASPPRERAERPARPASRPAERGSGAEEPRRPARRPARPASRPSERGSGAEEPRRPAGRPAQPASRPSERGSGAEEPRRPTRRPAPADRPARPASRPAERGSGAEEPRRPTGRPAQPASRPSERGSGAEEPRRPARRPAGSAPPSARPGSRQPGASRPPTAGSRSGGRRGPGSAGPQSSPARSSGRRSSGPATGRSTRSGAGPAGRRPPAGGRGRPPRRGR